LSQAVLVHLECIRVTRIRLASKADVLKTLA